MVQPLGSIFMRAFAIGTVTFLVQIGFAFPWDCLERFHLGLQIGSKWVGFRIGPQMEPCSWKRVERFQMGPDRKFEEK